MGFLTAFLSYNRNEKDSDVVKRVGIELGRLGILPWIDQHALAPGDDLLDALPHKIKSQTVIVPFLSVDSVKSQWVQKELLFALELLDQEGGTNNIVPVWLGDPIDLTRQVPVLSREWISRDRLKIVGIEAPPVIPDPIVIAQGIARSIFKRQRFDQKVSATIVIDQRGRGGNRVNRPKTVPSASVAEGPVFVFRPDDGPRSLGEMLSEEDYRDFARGMGWALGEMGLTRADLSWELELRPVAQLALAAWLGRFLNRTNDFELWTFGRTVEMGQFKLNLRDFLKPPKDGKLNAIGSHRVLDDFKEPRDGSVSLLLMEEDEQRLRDAQAHIRRIEGPPPLWYPVPDRIEGDDAPVRIAADVVAACAHYGIDCVDLYTTLPAHVLPLVISLLSPYTLKRIDMLDYDGRPESTTRYLRYPLDVSLQ